MATQNRIAQPCLALDPIPGWEKTLWPLDAFHKAVLMAQELGLKIPSCHVFAVNLASHVSEMNGLAEAYGIDAYVVKTPSPITAEGLIQTASVYRDVMKQLKTAQLLLHNELEDGKTQVEGISAYEFLLKSCDGDIRAEVDAGWLATAGIDPKSFFSRYEKWIQMIHLKDFSLNDQGTKEVDVGTGIHAVWADAWSFFKLEPASIASSSLFTVCSYTFCEP